MAKSIEKALAAMTPEELRRVARNALGDLATVLDELDGRVDIEDGEDGQMRSNWAIRLKTEIDQTLWSAGVDPKDPFGLKAPAELVSAEVP